MNKIKTTTVKKSFTLSWIFFIVAYVAIAVGIGCWVWINTLKFENEVVGKTQQHLLTIARAESQRIEEFIHTNQSDAKILAKNPLVIKYLKDDLKAKSMLEADNLTLEYLFEHFKVKVDFIHWLNAKGIFVGGFPFVEEIIGRDESRNPDIKLMLDSHKPCVDIFEANSGNRLLCICNPVFENGSFLGLTRVLVSLDTINNLVSTVRAGEKGYAWVISESGIMMAHPKPEHRGVDIMEVRKEAFPDFDWSELEGIVNRMKSGEEGVGTYYSAWWTEEKPEIVRKLTAFSPINISARQKLWSIGVSLSYDEIAGPIKINALNNFLGAGCLLLAFGIGGIILFRVQRKGAEMEIIARSAEELRDLNTKLQSEIAERKQVEDDLKRKSKLIKLQQEITSTANDAENVEDALKSCMNKICSFSGWPVGHIYIPDSTGKLIPANIWYISDPEKFKDFQEFTHKTVFEFEEGLPGRTLSNGKPHWIMNVAEDSNFPRAQHARDVGIKSAFAFPILERKNIVAVLEFFSSEIVEQDKLMLESLGFLAIQLGRIIERKRAEDEFVKTQKLESVGVLAGGIAHDFNNYLQGILSNIAIAKSQTDSNNEIHINLTEVEKAVIQAKNLTLQLLTFSKGGDPIKKAVSVPELIKESAKFALSGSNIRCELVLPDCDCLVEIDKGQINQVFNNLFVNANHAMPEGGTIKVSAVDYKVEKNDLLPLQEGRYVKITIKDQGIGMSQEHLQKIFDPYFTTKEMGSGLGLATVFSIVKKHNGYITAESEIGVGTTFYIYLPVSLKKIMKEPDESKTEGVSSELVEEKDVEEATPLKGRKILFMEDDGIIRLSVTRQLRNLKYEIETARDGTEAIELYKSASESGKPFNAIVMDLTIPGGMGGEEAIKELLKIDPDVAAIVASGYSNDPIMTNFGEYGFKGVVEKPYEIDELNETLQNVINGLKG